MLLLKNYFKSNSTARSGSARDGATHAKGPEGQDVEVPSRNTAVGLNSSHTGGARSLSGVGEKSAKTLADMGFDG